MNEVILNRKIAIERCIQQIDAYYGVDTGMPFVEDYLKQDAIAMNLLSACEITVDIANCLIKRKKLGLRLEVWPISAVSTHPESLAEARKGLPVFPADIAAAASATVAIQVSRVSRKAEGSGPVLLEVVSPASRVRFATAAAM